MFQDPNYDEDTQWNDVLRAKGIIPAKKKEAEITEEKIVEMLESTIEQRTNGAPREKQIQTMTLDELDELEDSEDEAILEEYRRKRIAEMRLLSEKPRFGSVTEISGQDYVDEVNKAGKEIWVVLHLYANGVPLCNMIHHYMKELCIRFPHTKFLRSVATTCIPNFPEKNCPSIFVYYEGQMRKQFLGPLELRGEKLTVPEFEYLLGTCGAIPTELKDDPRPQIRDKMFSDLKNDDY